MPKETFINLPQPKRDKILDVSLDEFYEYGYEKASISRIVQRAGIAKGSFYQYFTGKEDLFRLVFADAGEKKLQYLTRLDTESGEQPFFEKLRIIYRGALEFIKDNPRLSAVVDRFMKSGQSSLKEAVLGEGIGKSSRFIEHLLVQAMERGEINSNIDPAFTAYYLTSLSISLGDYMRSRSAEAAETDEDAYINLVEQVLQLLKRGLQ